MYCYPPPPPPPPPPPHTHIYIYIWARNCRGSGINFWSLMALESDFLLGLVCYDWLLVWLCSIISINKSTMYIFSINSIYITFWVCSLLGLCLWSISLSLAIDSILSIYISLYKEYKLNTKWYKLNWINHPWWNLFRRQLKLFLLACDHKSLDVYVGASDLQGPFSIPKMIWI